MRSRRLAALLNLFFPGTGLLYAGRPIAAVVCLAAVLVLANIMPFLAFHPLPRPYAAVLLWAIPLGLLVALPVLGWRAAVAAHQDAGPGGWARGWSCVGFAVVALTVTNLNWRYVVRPRIEAFRVPSGSMEPTIMVGDFLYMAPVKRASPLPPRESIIVFESVEEEGLKVLKRLVGLPGDTLAMKGGTLYRNGAAVFEPYAVHSNTAEPLDSGMTAQVRRWQQGRLPGADSTRPASLSDWGPFAVPPDSFFVLGDNRDASYDGRYYGFIPRGNYLGRPALVYYSFDGSSKHALPFLSAIRWRRLGIVLKTP